ncbi:histidine kinase [Pelagicoccus sp. SDUM812002]|uniref:sensor histidine kinase n=1 Tax=Pelagicoccus sp. SDUM812002 TaxID=3041266 RepID=UPI00280F43A4|nr:histidine kinase [Pelagicoccus sp. SDUM812002]MDQ8186500.1 histidine kinase [Pelagicoccus sp. SDUM812002]
MATSETDSKSPSSRGGTKSFVLLFLLWTAVGLSFASQFYLSSSLSGRPVSWGQAISYSLADWYVWALLSLIVLRLAHRVPIERLRWSRHMLVHLIASILIALAYAFIRALVAQAQTWLIGDYASFPQVAEPLLFKTYLFNFIVYWVILSVAQAFDYYRKYHERELATLELERSLSEARLQALQTQLNPHFLFNAMHSISALMHSDVDAADSMLARLSELLRLTLKTDGAQTISLTQELAILERYLDIERVRFGDRLTIETRIAPETRDCKVPSLILQPVVENSLRHGIAPHARPGTLLITSELISGTLRITVSDNGGGLPEQIKRGIGLSNTSARLAELYGDQQSFSISNNTESPGTTAILSLPARQT